MHSLVDCGLDYFLEIVFGMARAELARVTMVGVRHSWEEGNGGGPLQDQEMQIQ